MTADIAHKHVCSVAGYIVCGHSGETTARIPDDGLLDGVAVNEIPALDVRSVNFYLERACTGKPYE